MSRPESVRLPTRERISEAVRVTGYTLNQAARSLRQRTSRTILVALPDIGNTFFSTILDAIERESCSRGYGVLVVNRFAGDGSGRRLHEYFLSNRADGLLLLDGSVALSQLLELTGARWHADQITTAAALPALERARAAGLDVTAGTSIHHATLNALDVADWRTFFKVKPPLRDEADRRATAEALASGLIDILCSMHTPQDEESKRLPFEEAASGAVALETLLPAALRLVHAGHLSLPQLFRALSLNPAKRLGLNCGRLAPGAPADLVLFDPDASVKLDRFDLQSKSKNTPFDGAILQGRVIATYVRGVDKTKELADA